jgi:hypothetical protein
MTAVRASTAVSRPWPEVQARLLDEPWRLFQGATGSRTGLLSVPVAGFQVGRPARIVLGAAVAEPGRVRLSVEWRARSAAPLFPTMRAELVATPVNAGTVRLDLDGRYRPPAGILGRLADRLIGRRVAVASLSGLVDGLARQLELGTKRTA